MVIGPDGLLYFADTMNNRIRVIDEEHNVHTVLGGGFDTHATLPEGVALSLPVDLAFDSRGDLYVVEMGGHCIRKLSKKTGKVSVVAGQVGDAGYGGDGEAAEDALLNGPSGIAISANDEIYVADSRNHIIRVIRTRPSQGCADAVPWRGSDWVAGRCLDPPFQEVLHPLPDPALIFRIELRGIPSLDVERLGAPSWLADRCRG